MHTWQEHPNASDACAQALSLMAERGIAPTPVNFELWFHYAVGTDLDLKRALDAAVDSGRAKDHVRAKEIHTRFFVRMDEKVEEASAIVHRELGQLSSALQQAGEGTAQYGNALDDVRSRLKQAGATPQVDQIITRASDATAEMERRNRTLEAQVEASKKEIATLKSRMEAVRQESRVDSLTELANRRAFEEFIASTVRDAEVDGKPLCVLMCDIDHFKRFNDTWGHSTGDQVLRLVAALTKSNIKGKDLAARFGGEEIVIVLPDTHLSDALKVAEQIRTSIEAKKIVKKSTGTPLGQITVSIGAAKFIRGDTPQSLLDRADVHLYAAKQSGRNRVAWILRNSVDENRMVVGSDVLGGSADGKGAGAAASTARGTSAGHTPIPALEIEFIDHDTPLIIDAEMKMNDPRLLKLFQWWLGLRPARGLPAWSDTFLSANEDVTDFLHLHHYLPREDMLRVAFVGKFLVKALQTDPTGQVFDASHAPTAELLSNGARVFEVARLTRHMQEPLRAYSKRVRNLRSGTYASELIMLPFGSDDAGVNTLLGATIYTPVDA